jgi:hypothetical protein
MLYTYVQTHQIAHIKYVLDGHMNYTSTKLLKQKEQKDDYKNYIL